MKGWTLQDVQALLPEEYQELCQMLEDEARAQRSPGDLDD